VRKTVAALSASILGVSGAAMAAAAPAAAAPLPACTSIDQHTVSASANTQSWYMDCIPQYGLGKAEFTITSSTPYPSGYSLTDGHQTVTSTVNDTAVAAYLGDSESTLDGALTFLEENGGSTPTTQTYSGTPIETQAVFPVSSVAQIDPADLPAGTTGCFPNTETYAHAYEVTFLPVTTTFKETIDGKVWTTTITATPQPLILGLNFEASPGTGFDPTAAQCASSGGVTLVADNNSSGNWTNVSANEATLNEGIFDENSLDPSGDGTTLDLGTFTTTDTPVLAETGYDATPAGMLGGGLLAAGIALIALRFTGSVRRRARRS
jgi:hypothetical protein